MTYKTTSGNHCATTSLLWQRGAIQLNPFLGFAFRKLEDVEFNKIPSEMEASLPHIKTLKSAVGQIIPLLRGVQKIIPLEFLGNKSIFQDHFGTVQYSTFWQCFLFPSWRTPI